MKKFYSVVIGLLLIGNVTAQAPNKMSYQAVVRDASNSLVTSKPVGMQISILQGSVSGTPVYEETQNPTTSTLLGVKPQALGSVTRAHACGPFAA